jgi:hypothetical protein
MKRDTDLRMGFRSALPGKVPRRTTSLLTGEPDAYNRLAELFSGDFFWGVLF